jgi:hypothetical protein
MFLQFQRQLEAAPPAGYDVFDLSATELVGLLEEAWARRYLGANAYFGAAEQHRARLSSANPLAMRALFAGLVEINGQNQMLSVNESLHQRRSSEDISWNHMIFAFCIEATYAYEIFGKVIFEYTSGIRREVPDAEALRFLATTEALFYTQPLPYSVLSLTSELRREIRAVRANDYARMFGLPVNHPTWNGQPYPKAVTGAANLDFVPTLEEFLREVWRGITNANNQSGTNDTDDAAIARLARRLFDMLVTARRYGTLDRHEFVHVAAFSWLYLALLRDWPIIRQLKAEGSSPYERLRSLAARVSLAPHSRTEQFFALADSLPVLLRVIETGRLNDIGLVPALYRPGPNRLRELVGSVITNWSIATGRDIKGEITVANRLRSELPAARPGIPSSPPAALPVARR